MNVDLESLKIFVKVAELGSFTRAGEHLGMRKARVSRQLKVLETELGIRLLQRSTRVVRLTPDGEVLLPRARRLVLEADEIGAMFQGARALRGRVRIDLPMNFARNVIIPRLPDLLARHPELEVLVSTTDRRVEAFREGFDCVLRIGAPGDAGLVGRRLGLLRMMNCASPSYLLKHGTPHRLEDLDRHLIVHCSSAPDTEVPSFEYPHDGVYRERPMRSVITVNSGDASLAACVAGLGIIQAPRTEMLTSVAAGALVEVLPTLTCAPIPVSLLHTHGRSVPRRVRAVMSWISELLSPHLEALDH
jgi:DNA-binding transcriptional LysR family regulator